MTYNMTTLPAELINAGLVGLPFALLEDGLEFREGITDADRARVQAVLDAHDPSGLLPVLAPSSATKLGLKRAFSEAGGWPAIKALIASDPDIQEEWDLCTEVRRTDRLVQGMIQARGYEPEQVDAILIRAAELVA